VSDVDQCQLSGNAERFTGDVVVSRAQARWAAPTLALHSAVLLASAERCTRVLLGHLAAV